MFEGMAAFITGGGTGIGLACATTIVERGGLVTLAGRRADVLAEAARRLGDSAGWVECDITNADSVSQAISTAVERNGPLVLAVNSAYQAMAGSILGTPDDLFAMTTDSTLNGTFRALQAEGQAMVDAGRGGASSTSVRSRPLAAVAGSRPMPPRRPASTC